MQKQFKREQRYFVVKVKDAKEYLDAHQLEKLAEIADTISEGREKGGIPAVECVVVESDWPEYESTWRAIEDRVTGAQPAPFDDSATIAGLESTVTHLSVLLDSFRALLVEVNDVCGRDGHGGQLEDGESEIIDKVRAAISMTEAPPCAKGEEK